MTTEVITGLSKDSNLTSDFRDGNYSEHIASENKTCDNIVDGIFRGNYYKRPTQNRYVSDLSNFYATDLLRWIRW